MTVEYREVVGCPGYRVGDDGSVWTLWTRIGKGRGANGGRYSGKTNGWTWQIGTVWRLLAATVQKKYGYLVVGLRTASGKRKQFRVHTLVLTAFVGRRPSGCQACHDPDRTKTNCRLDNLRWGTPSDNRQDSIRHGTQVRGESVGTSILIEDEVKQIIERLKRRDNRTVIAADYGIKPKTVENIARNVTWRHIPRD